MHGAGKWGKKKKIRKRQGKKRKKTDFYSGEKTNGRTSESENRLVNDFLRPPITRRRRTSYPKFREATSGKGAMREILAPAKSPSDKRERQRTGDRNSLASPIRRTSYRSWIGRGGVRRECRYGITAVGSRTARKGHLSYILIGRRIASGRTVFVVLVGLVVVVVRGDSDEERCFRGALARDTSRRALFRNGWSQPAGY